MMNFTSTIYFEVIKYLEVFNNIFKEKKNEDIYKKMKQIQ